MLTDISRQRDATPGKERYRVLVADRSANVAELVALEIREDGLEASVACDGREVLRRVTSKAPPHVLVMDPDIDGSELVRQTMLAGVFPIPVVLHVLRQDHGRFLPLSRAAVPKSGDLGLLLYIIRLCLEQESGRRGQALAV
jgi:CheY-like chemotaxis protein